MKILCIIDHFGSGGAQKQICTLAIGLLDRGHKVEFFNYYPEYRFFRKEVEKVGIKVHDCIKKNKGFSFNVIKALRKLLIVNKYDVAISFLDTPNIYLLLSGVFCKTKLIVSDRNSHLREKRLKAIIKRQIYRISDYVVSNSHSQRKWLIKDAHLPTKKTVTIYNGFSDHRFAFSPLTPTAKNELKLLGIGRINPQKNIETFITALDIFQKRHDWCPNVTWVGISDDSDYEKKILSYLNFKNQVKKSWTWTGVRHDIPQLMAKHHALILPSLYEGLPNVVCEAMYSGKPVLGSNVNDIPILVIDGKRGFLFDPKVPESIADSLEKLINLNNDEWARLSFYDRDYAIANLSMENMVREYERLF